MTDTVSQVSVPGGSDREDRPGALECFDAHGTAVYASLCRSTAGDDALATTLLASTFVELGRRLAAGLDTPIDRQGLLLDAHRTYLADPRSGDDYDDEVDRPASSGFGPTAASADDATPWVHSNRDHAVMLLRGLTPRERIAINLHLVDGIDRVDVAELLGQAEERVDAAIDTGRRAVAITGGRETVDDLLRRCETWFGDDDRDDIRVALGAVSRRTKPALTADVTDEPRQRWRPTRSTLVAAVAVALIAAGGVRWVQTLPEVESPAPEPIAAMPQQPLVVTSGNSVASTTVNGVTTEVSVSAVRNATSATDVLFLSSGLSEPAVVVPDAIIKYSDGKIGVSWHGPCNRPAIALAVTNTVDGAVIELTTGEFPVLSCVGIPDRWSAVVESAVPLAEGGIRPLDDAGVTVTAFDGYVEASSPGGTSDPISDDALYGSALVDDANQPWVYGVGCSSRSARYQSPIGAIYEIRRTAELDPNSYSSSDAIVCNELAARPVLTGPLGAKFPNGDAASSASPPAEPIDCNGPIGSHIDVPSQRPYDTRLHDGDWSTWDGCLVRSDVIFSQATFEACPGADVRTVTIAPELGERFRSGDETLTYVRDPLSVVAGTRPPLLTYIIAPSDLIDTGLRFGDQSLWVSPRAAEAVYVRVGDDVERWPLLTDELTCT